MAPWQDPPQSGEMVDCGGTIAPLMPTPHLKLTPWGELCQWHEAKAETFGGCIRTIGKWIPVPKG